jgi:hypothetical protein
VAVLLTEVLVDVAVTRLALWAPGSQLLALLKRQFFEEQIA